MDDHDEHVHVRDRFEDLLRVMIVMRFFEDAIDRIERSKRELEAAQHRVVDAHEYWARTRETLMQAIRLRAMRRR